MDVFLLMEIICYLSIHFEIKDISELLNEDYLDNYAQHLYQYYQEIDQDIIKKILFYFIQKKMSGQGVPDGLERLNGEF